MIGKMSEQKKDYFLHTCITSFIRTGRQVTTMWMENTWLMEHQYQGKVFHAFWNVCSVIDHKRSAKELVLFMMIFITTC